MDFDEEDDPAGDILYAARTGDAEWLLELLAAHKQLVTTADPNGNTPLHFAAANGHDRIIKILLKHPQPISPKNSAGNTPLHWACLNNHASTVKLLVGEGADMFVKNGAGRDAVWEVEQRGNEELVTWMLSIGEEQATGEVQETDEEVGPEDVQGETSKEETSKNGVNKEES